MKLPELLSPAGNLEKLKVAISYGADAVYCGGQNFGLRAASDNLTHTEMKEGVEFAHSKGAKLFVVLNSFLHDKDLEELPEYLKFLEGIRVNAVIVSDLGVIETVKDNCDIPIHLSTQASCLNLESAKFWKTCGVKRIIFGREVSLEDAAFIKRETGLEVELFIHGSMCMAYSGNCTISNFTQGRDSNRGGCAHSCRFEYSMSGVDKNAYFMSSKDLMGLNLLEKFINLEIDSIKIEGRMKGHVYAALTAKTYRQALDHYAQNKTMDAKLFAKLDKQLRSFSHRDYTNASLENPADSSSIFDEREHISRDSKILGIVQQVVKGEKIVVQSKNHSELDGEVELIAFNSDAKRANLKDVQKVNATKMDKINPNCLFTLPYIKGVEKFNIVKLVDRGLS